MIHPPQAHPMDLTAFSQTCPGSNEVTALLEELGLLLVFSMPSRTYWVGKTQTLPDLPAQFHYRDSHETEVVYLAGKDTPEFGAMRYPLHASRWWLYPGSSPYAFNLVAQTLSAQFGIQWPTQGADKS